MSGTARTQKSGTAWIPNWIFDHLMPRVRYQELLLACLVAARSHFDTLEADELWGCPVRLSEEEWCDRTLFAAEQLHQAANNLERLGVLRIEDQAYRLAARFLPTFRLR